MQEIRLGTSGPAVSRVGLGCMGMSDFYGPADEAESIATIHAALEAGITLLDTGDFYGMGHNEMLLRDALKGGKRDRAVLSVKFGAMRSVEGAFLGYALKPAQIQTWLAYSLKRLGTDHIDVYRPARLDPEVPIEDVAGTVKDLIDKGYVRHLGLSEASADTVLRAHAVTPVSDLQIEYSLMSRGIEADTLPKLRSAGIGITAYGILSRGLISSTALNGQLGTGHRTVFPRLAGENLSRNLQLVEALAKVAEQRGATPAQLAIAWVLHRGEDIVPLIGARKRTQLAESVGALNVRLSDGERTAIEAAIPVEAVQGTRYLPDQMAHLDSEKNG
ncbi:aldo/keto reductase [Rhizomicrobium electricum]|uniref:Aldo/keto reductase n=1 Tax=Rhizomicrobium electricum TaxID=480070 RepID=A0ABP3PUT6_9PROT|nr:aldo/keto reductase [Rhizomicrobium electricum]